MVVSIRLLLLSSLLVVGLSSPTTAEPTLPANAEALVAEGVKAYDAEDYQRAKEILLPLAEAGHPEAMNKIGIMTKFGQGFVANSQKACDWYEKAASKGLAKSMYNLSICYNQGNGRQKNNAEMLSWRRKAAFHGSKSAMINLAALDPNEGEEYRKWMLMAQDHGSAYAKVSLWLQGYKSDSLMKPVDLICVTWNILYGEHNFEYCD